VLLLSAHSVGLPLKEKAAGLSQLSNRAGVPATALGKAHAAPRLSKAGKLIPVCDPEASIVNVSFPSAGTDHREHINQDISTQFNRLASFCS